MRNLLRFQGNAPAGFFAASSMLCHNQQTTQSFSPIPARERLMFREFPFGQRLFALVR
jgi:hypothetical protein